MLDVLIIGAGFAGVATAYFLSQVSAHQPPLKIALLEKEASPGKHASGLNAGMFRQAVLPFETAVCIQRTKHHWRNWNSSGESPAWFKKTGSFLLGEKKALYLLQQFLTQAGGHSEIFPQGEFPKKTNQQLIQQLKASPYEALLFIGDDGVVETKNYLQELLQRASHQGVQLHFNTAIQKLKWCKDFWEVQHTCGVSYAKVVVNAGGAWANSIASEAGLQGPEMISYRRHLFISNITQNINTQTWPIVWNVNEEVYFRAFENGLLLSSGDETPHPAEVPKIDSQIEKLLYSKLAKNFPQLTLVDSPQRVWACLRTKSQTGQMIVGPDLAQPNFIWAAALAGHGLSSSLGVGEKTAMEVMKIFKFLTL